MYGTFQPVLPCMDEIRRWWCFKCTSIRINDSYTRLNLHWILHWIVETTDTTNYWSIIVIVGKNLVMWESGTDGMRGRISLRVLCDVDVLSGLEDCLRVLWHSLLSIVFGPRSAVIQLTRRRIYRCRWRTTFHYLLLQTRYCVTILFTNYINNNNNDVYIDTATGQIAAKTTGFVLFICFDYFLPNNSIAF